MYHSDGVVTNINDTVKAQMTHAPWLRRFDNTVEVCARVTALL